MAQVYIKKDIETVVKASAKQFPALIITGPRQSGKTTLLKHLFLKNHTYVSMDDPALRLEKITRNFHGLGKLPRIFWWRTSYGEEVDFIIEDKGKLIPIEVKLTAKSDNRVIKALASFCELFSDKVDAGYLVNLSAEKLIMGKHIISLLFFNLVNESLLGIKV